MIRRLSLLIALFAALLTVAFANRGKTGHAVMRVDAGVTRGERHVELPDGTVLEAVAGELGWEFEIHDKPVSDGSLNLLYNGSSLHGIQPWMAFAWTKHWRAYPDVREIRYGSPEKTIRIELVDCTTTQQENRIAFSAGEIAVYWAQ